MADKGFTIRHHLYSKKASLVIPPFLGKRDKFAKADVTETHEIACLRIHVERAIKRVKEYPLEFSRLGKSMMDNVYPAHKHDLQNNQKYQRENKEKFSAYRANMTDELGSDSRSTSLSRISPEICSVPIRQAMQMSHTHPRLRSNLPKLRRRIYMYQ